MKKRIYLAALASVASLAAISGSLGYHLASGRWPGFVSLPPAEEHVHAPVASAGVAAKEERKLLYYRNPMGLADTSKEPKKDWMGMDYIPVYEGEEEEEGSSTFKVSLDKVQRAGVRTEAAGMRRLASSVRAPGVAKPDERSLRTVTLRADGYVEKLYVNTKGQQVKAGEPLFRFYSPKIVSAQIDYKNQISTKSAGSSEDAELYTKAIAERYRKLGMPEEEIARLQKTGSISQAFDVPSPADGVVMEKNVIEGQMVKAGDELYRLVDLGNIWVIADVAEQDVASVSIGSPARVKFRAYPDQEFDGRVTFVLHQIDPSTRTAKVRIEVANGDHRVKHEMYADVEIDAGTSGGERLVVPASAVIDSGDRQVVFVERGEGRFEPRTVKLGTRSGGLIEIREGLDDGEKVVVAANFLIDAESNLKAALGGFTAEGMKPLREPVATPPALESKP